MTILIVDAFIYFTSFSAKFRELDGKTKPIV